MRFATTVVEALDTMLAEVDMPPEALPTIALAYSTARKLDEWRGGTDGYSPLANSMLKQIAALREWITPPPVVVDEDPFDALARALAGNVDDD